MRVWISILLFVLSFHQSEGCSCAYPGPTEKGLLCDADFIIKTRVQSILRAPQDGDEFNYFFRIQRPRRRHIFKLENNAQLTDTSLRRVYTASNGGLCGMYLQKGQTYLIAGRVSGSKLHIALCSAYTERLPLSSDTRKLLFQFRKNKVDCSTGLSAGRPKTSWRSAGRARRDYSDYNEYDDEYEGGQRYQDNYWSDRRSNHSYTDDWGPTMD